MKKGTQVLTNGTPVVKIAVAYHKPSLILQNESLLPLHVGRALTDVDLAIPGDDTGDHISQKNIHYAELTATYWAWKNIRDADYLGLFHYRRLLDFSGTSSRPTWNLPLDSTPDVLERLALGSGSIARACQGYDIITRKIEDLHDWSEHTVRSHYAAVHTACHLEIAEHVVAEMYPDYREPFRELLAGSTGYFANVVIMRREIYHEYCDWLFSILENIEPLINHYERQHQKYHAKARIYGFLGERLTSLFIQKRRAEGLRISEVPLAALVPRPGAAWHDYDTYDERSYQETRYGILHNRPKDANQDRPAVTVVIPAFNAAKTIGRALDSVLRQTLESLEVIVVNDGSRDTTVNVIDHYASKDPRIRVAHQENTGQGIARNRGIALARGEYVHLMDADDFMDSTFLAELHRKAIAHDAEVVVAPHRTLDVDDLQLLGTIGLPSTVLAAECTRVERTPDLLLVPCHPWDKLFRRDFITRFPFTKEGGEDIFFFWRWVVAAERVAIYKETLYNYVVDLESVQSRPDYLFGVFNTVERTDDFLSGTHPEAHRYFSAWKLSLLGHMIHRNQLNLRRDEGFRRKFWEASTGLLDGLPSISHDLLQKLAVFGGDPAAILRLKGASCESWWRDVQLLLAGDAQPATVRLRSETLEALVRASVAARMQREHGTTDTLDACLSALLSRVDQLSERCALLEALVEPEYAQSSEAGTVVAGGHPASEFARRLRSFRNVHPRFLKIARETQRILEKVRLMPRRLQRAA